MALITRNRGRASYTRINFHQPNQMQTVEPEEAKLDGYRALTTGYKLPKDGWMLNNVVDDLKRGHIKFVFVDTMDGIEIWRKGCKFN